MPTFEQGDVVRVPFPYTDRPVRQHRPALVISSFGTGEDQRLVWVLMITSAANRSWPGDVDIGDNYLEAGLPVRSRVRTAKIASIDKTQADRIGRIGEQLVRTVLDEVAEALYGQSGRPSRSRRG